MNHTRDTKRLAAIRRPVRIALLTAGCALAVVACGSARTQHTTTGSSIAAQQVKYAVCMRASGVPNYPVPSLGSGIDAIPLNSGINAQSPAFRAAQQVCAKLNPADSVRVPAETASQKQADLNYAQCMRAHDVPSYPDPAYSKQGTKIEKPLATYGIRTDSPAFRRAANACQQA